MNIRDLIDDGEPAVGDIVEIEMGDHLVETIIDEVLEDGVVIRVNEEMLSLMIEHKRKLNESQAQQAAIAVNMKKAGKKPKNQPLDEISSKLAGEYYSAATKQHVDKVGMRPNMYNRIERDMGAKRKQGMDRAFDRITRDSEKVDENNWTRDPWHEKYFGPTTEVIKKIFKVKTDNGKSYNVKAETEKRAIEVMKEYYPELNVTDIKFVKNLMAEGNYSDSMTDAEWEREYQREKAEKELARKEIEKNHRSQFKTKEEAIQYANDKLKTFKDSKIGMSVYAMPDGGFDVASTARTAAAQKRSKLMSDAGGKHLGTLGPRYTKHKMAEADDPCWKGYKQVGTKDKDGRQVPNCVPNESVEEGKTGPGLWANIHAKRKRIEAGSGERMRKPGSEGAPKASDFKAARDTNESSNYGDLDEDSNKFEIGQRVTYTNSNGQQFPSIVTAIDFDEDAVKIRSANNKPFPNSGGDIEIVVDPGWKFLTPDRTYDPNSLSHATSRAESVEEAKYQGREVTLNQPMAGDVKKSKVYVKNAKGNVVKVNFGQKGVKIKKSNPGRRKSFRARHGCDNPGPKWKAKYWSCRAW